MPPQIEHESDYALTDLGRPIGERVCDLIEAIYAELPGIVAHQRGLDPATGSAPHSGGG